MSTPQNITNQKQLEAIKNGCYTAFRPNDIENIEQGKKLLGQRFDLEVPSGDKFPQSGLSLYLSTEEKLKQWKNEFTENWGDCVIYLKKREVMDCTLPSFIVDNALHIERIDASGAAKARYFERHENAPLD
jgi:hypothetical protein